MSSLFKVKTPDVKIPEPERMPDIEDMEAAKKKRELELRRTSRGSRDKTILSSVEGGGGKEYAGVSLGGPS